MNWLVQHKFVAMLAAVLLLVVGFPLTRGQPIAKALYIVLYSVVFCSAVVAVSRKKNPLRLAIALGAPTLVLGWITLTVPVLGEFSSAVLFHCCAVVFLIFLVTTVLRSIYAESQISTDSVCGAFCGYLIVGLVFAHLYCLTEIMAPRSFRGPEDVVARLGVHEERYFVLVYFSLVTLTTVGYGEITPGSELTRSLAVVEAILGQFYIAVLIADLIGKKLSQAVIVQSAKEP